MFSQLNTKYFQHVIKCWGTCCCERFCSLHLNCEDIWDFRLYVVVTWRDEYDSCWRIAHSYIQISPVSFQFIDCWTGPSVYFRRWRERTLLGLFNGRHPESCHLIFCLFLSPWIMNKIISVCSMKFLPHFLRLMIILFKVYQLENILCNLNANDSTKHVWGET